MSRTTGVKISFAGTAIEGLGILLDIFHHLNIGLETPEGLLTPFHFLILFGFLINFVGVIITASSRRDK
ncbi:MAG TPA: hypothetical protein VJJ72_02000 [Candidatus Paceibacterota bacterium]